MRVGVEGSINVEFDWDCTVLDTGHAKPKIFNSEPENINSEPEIINSEPETYNCALAAEYYRPLITPMELEIALVKGREWTGDYNLDFRPLLYRP